MVCPKPPWHSFSSVKVPKYKPRFPNKLKKWETRIVSINRRWYSKYIYKLRAKTFLDGGWARNLGLMWNSMADIQSMSAKLNFANDRCCFSSHLCESVKRFLVHSCVCCCFCNRLGRTNLSDEAVASIAIDEGRVHDVLFVYSQHRRLYADNFWHTQLSWLEFFAHCFGHSIERIASWST